MAKPIPSNATPEMLKWARESAHYSVESVAEYMKLSRQTLTDWESGKGTPSLATLRRLARRYKRPLMVFFLESLPTGFPIVKDFRLLPTDISQIFSPALQFAIRLAQERQAWAEGYLESEGYGPNRLAGHAKGRQSPSKVGRELRAMLGVGIELQATSHSENAGFVIWRRACESLGVFVFQVPGVRVEEMRGFALPSMLAPIAAVNARDTPTARTFTLLHEVAHLLRGESAVSGGESGPQLAKAYPSEWFCNQVAAEVLAPEQDFKANVPEGWLRNDDDVIATLSRRYKLSRAFIVMRLLELGYVTNDYVRTKLPSINKAPGPRRGKVPRLRVVVSRVGESFARTAVAAFHSGAIHGGELTSLMDMPLKYLPALEKRMAATLTKAT